MDFCPQNFDSAIAFKFRFQFNHRKSRMRSTQKAFATMDSVGMCKESCTSKHYLKSRRFSDSYNSKLWHPFLLPTESAKKCILN